MEITYKTEVEELLDAESLTAEVDNVKNDIKKKIDPRMESLELEMTVGGLSKQALMFDDYSPLYDKASRINSNYELIENELSGLQRRVNLCSWNQRRKELTTLKTKIEERMEQLNALKNIALDNARKIETGSNPYAYGPTASQYRQYAREYEDEYKQLKVKKQKVIGQLSKAGRGA